MVIATAVGFAMFGWRVLRSADNGPPLENETGKMVMDLGDIDALDNVKALAARMATDGTGLGYKSTAIETKTFYCRVTASKTGARLVAFSDDGVNVFIKAATESQYPATAQLPNIENKQHLPDTSQSVHEVPFDLQKDVTYDIRLDYRNQIYTTGGSDVDGCKLFAYKGGVTPQLCGLSGVDPSPALVAVGSDLKFTAEGSDLANVTWSAPGATPATGSGSTFTTKWTTTGSQTVTARCPASDPNAPGVEAAVTVVGVASVAVDPASTPSCYGGVFLTGDPVQFVATFTPANAEIPAGVTWELVSRPDESKAEISGTGPTAELTPDKPGAYRVRVKLGTSSAETTVTALEKPRVGLWGDTYAIEGSNRNGGFSLMALRPRGQAPFPHDIVVSYRVIWDSAEPTDFTPADVTSLTAGTLTIPAGARASIPILFTPVSDAPAADDKNPETFLVKLKEGTCYSPPNPKEWDTYPRENFPAPKQLRESLNYRIYECMTPFVKGADDEDISADNPGIDGSDANQGSLPDCYCMASLGSIAESCPGTIQAGIRDGIGDDMPWGWQVRLFFQKEGDNQSQWHWIRVTESALSHGPNMGEPSGDIDPDTGCAEIWPVLYEQAIQTASSMVDSNFTGPKPGDVGHESAGVVRMVTGQESETISLVGKTDEEILAIIQEHFVPARKNIIYETKRATNNDPEMEEPEETEWRLANEDMDHQVPPQPHIVQGHAYYVQGVTSSAVQLDNPWGESQDPRLGETDLNLPVKWLSETAKSLTILAPCGN